MIGNDEISPSTTNFSQMISKASTPPQIRKLGVMPCQSPVSIHTMIRFRIVVRFPFLLVSILLCTPHWYRLIVRNRKKLPVILILTAVFWFSVYRITISESNPFMYFSF